MYGSHSIVQKLIYCLGIKTNSDIVSGRKNIIKQKHRWCCPDTPFYGEVNPVHIYFLISCTLFPLCIFVKPLHVQKTFSTILKCVFPPACSQGLRVPVHASPL